MSDPKIHVLRPRFRREVQPAMDTPPTLNVERLSNPLRTGFGYLTQLYGLMVGAALYSDYDVGIDGDIVHMTMRPFGKPVHAPRVWMSLEHDAQARSWIFCYRSMTITHNDVKALMIEAHRRIAGMERRDLAPLLTGAVIPAFTPVKA